MLYSRIPPCRPSFWMQHGRLLHSRSTVSSHRRPYKVLAPFAVGTGTLVCFGSYSVYSDVREGKNEIPMTTLLRSYVVYTMCSIPLLVDWSPSIISMLFAVPVVRQVSESIIRHTFFRQFVGGDSVEDTVPLIQSMRAGNKGVLLAYSVEVDESTATGKTQWSGGDPTAVSSKHIIQEMIHCIEIAADFEDRNTGRESLGKQDGKRTWVALKLTALTSSPSALINLSSYLVQTRPGHPHVPFPGVAHNSDLAVLETSDAATQNEVLSQGDIQCLRELRDDLLKICTRAQERGVKVIIDAEYSWFQPGIDAFTLMLMRKFNQVDKRDRSWWFLPSWLWIGQPKSNEADNQPLIYATYQAYLRRTPKHLRFSMEDAKHHHYALGVKLVRGAYHPHEIEYHKQQPLPKASEPPVWTSKAETDECYNQCVEALISSLTKTVRSSDGIGLGILFGTHNWSSAKKILNDLVEAGLARVMESATDDEMFIALDQDVAEHVAIGQLFGMSDALTEHLVTHIKSASPVIIKYVPYGALAEVMPYLSRRAIENKSVLGGAGGAKEERRLAAQALWGRVFGSY